MLSIRPEDTQIILIGTSCCPDDDEFLSPLPAVRNNIDDLADIFCDYRIIGIPSENITQIVDFAEPSRVSKEINKAAKKAKDALIIYYSGHGLMGRAPGFEEKLFLAVGNTTDKGAFYNGLSFEFIQSTLNEVNVNKKILILDCCYSSRVISTMASSSESINQNLDIKGVYVMTSALRFAKAPPGERHTAFSGKLIKRLQNGIEGQGKTISLEALYQAMRQDLDADDFPEPGCLAFADAHKIQIALNRAYCPDINEKTILIGDAGDLRSRQYREFLKTYIEENCSSTWQCLDREDVFGRGLPTPEACGDVISKCGLYLALVGEFYGQVHTEGEAKGLSYTEFELKTAKLLGMPVMVLKIPETDTEIPTDYWRQQARFIQHQDALKSRLSTEYTVEQLYDVTDDDDLKQILSEYLARLVNASETELETSSKLILPPSRVAFFGEPDEAYSFNRRPVRRYHLEDLDQTLISNFLDQPATQDVLRTEGLLRASKLEKMCALGLAYEEGSPAFATFLCFAPRNLLIDKFASCRLSLCKFDHPDKGEAKFTPQLIEDNLINLFDRGMDFLRTQSGLQRTGLIGTDMRDNLEIPDIVLREALANALVHRDYEDLLYREQASRVEVYPDRVEFISFGGSKVDLNKVEKIYPYSPNPVIADIFRYMQIVELGGSGIQRMYAETKKANLSEPRIVEEGGKLTIVRVRFDRKPSAQSFVFSTPVNKSFIPLQMPPLPDHFVERPEQQRQVKENLLCEATKSGTLVVSAIYGLGGIGKSVLAAKLAREPDVQSHFLDGILWATLGQNPDILPLLSGWIQALGDNDYKPTATESASNHLKTLLHDKRVLLVVDDVWNPEHLEPFRVGGEGSCVLVTTREARISGAHRHELDVMSPEQSLELMTQKLSEQLSDIDRQQALSLAGRVGYLPLALELAASQIEDGTTWQELVEDFQSEIVRLETLDVYGQAEIPDDQKRRQYSLLACFNLSLQQLSTEQLRQFAWLGVVPEDVSLTQEMVETLWQVTSRQAGSILRTFKSKALVLQGAKQADDRPSYRMHDLMHDLAQRLLMNPPQPLTEGELPGLGLTRSEAHSQLLEHYRRKTDKGQWHTLEDDGYIYAFLTWHMEQANQPESIHQLLRASNEAGRNGWYEACDAIGKPAGFVNDIGRAWTQAVDDYERVPSQTVVRLFRYALMRASLNSLASNVPAQLVGALVEKGIWQPAQGLAYAQQAQNPWQRAECISVIVLHMPKALLPEVLKTIGQIKDAVYHSYVLSKLAERFPEVWPDVLSAIQQIQDRYGDHRRQTNGFSYRGLALRRIAQHLPSQYLGHALAITRQIHDASDRAIVLIVMSERLPELLPEALSVVREIKDESARSSALRELAEHLPELLPEALSMVREIKDESARSSALRELAEYLPAELLPEALSVVREIKDESARSSALREFADHLPELWPEALSVVREIKDESARSSALREFADHLPELWPEALSVVREIKDESARSSALSKLAENLPAELLSEALSVVREIKDESARSSALSKLAENLPELWPEALSVVREIKDESARSPALRELAEYLPAELLPEALSMVREIEAKFARSSALRELAEHLPAELLPEALSMVREIKDEPARSSALRELAEHLPELWPEALRMTREIEDKSARSYALIGLAKHLPELWPEALRMTREIEDESARSYALIGLAKHLPAELWSEALSVTREIEDKSARSYALIGLAKHLPELWPEALSVTREIEDKSARSSALIGLAKHLPELWSEALSVTREIEDESTCSSALRELAKHLPAELLPEALSVTREIEDESARSYALIGLAKHLPELWSEALSVMREIEDESARSYALIGLAKHLPELWPEALSVTREIENESARSSALSELAEHLPAELLPEALRMTREIKDESARSSALSELAEHLPAELFQEALESIWDLKENYFRSNALQGFLSHLENLSIPFPKWRQILDDLAYQNRGGLISTLPEVRLTLIRLADSEDGFLEILQAIREVCQQWP